jgi:hypothetical protein
MLGGVKRTRRWTARVSVMLAVAGIAWLAWFTHQMDPGSIFFTEKGLMLAFGIMNAIVCAQLVCAVAAIVMGLVRDETGRRSAESVVSGLLVAMLGPFGTYYLFWEWTFGS